MLSYTEKYSHHQPIDCTFPCEAKAHQELLVIASGIPGCCIARHLLHSCHAESLGSYYTVVWPRR
jgi:hypothetical protein